MKRYATKTTQSIPQQTPVDNPPTLPGQNSNNLSISDLLDKANTILQREIQNLLIASSGGKLDASNARDLCNYIKLLNELKEAQNDTLKNLSEDDLKKLLTK